MDREEEERETKRGSERRKRRGKKEGGGREVYSCDAETLKDNLCGDVERNKRKEKKTEKLCVLRCSATKMKKKRNTVRKKSNVVTNPIMYAGNVRFEVRSKPFCLS